MSTRYSPVHSLFLAKILNLPSQFHSKIKFSYFFWFWHLARRSSLDNFFSNHGEINWNSYDWVSNKSGTVILDSNQNKIIIIFHPISRSIRNSFSVHFRGFVTILFKIVPLWFRWERKKFLGMKMKTDRRISRRKILFCVYGIHDCNAHDYKMQEDKI